MNRTGMDSVNTAPGYPQVAETEVKPDKGQSRNGYEVVKTTSAPVLTSPDIKEAASTQAYRKRATIGQRLTCPFATAGNLFIKTIYKTVQRAASLASIPGFLVGGIAGAVASIPVAGVVKLVEMLARTNTNYGPKVFLGAVILGATLGGSTTGGMGACAGVIAGVGLGIVGGLIGFGKGLRDAVTGDVHRLEREKLTLKDFFKQVSENKERSEREWQAFVEQLAEPQSSDGMTNKPGSPTAASESSTTVLRDDQSPFDFSRVNLELLQENGTKSTA